jgi:hypothetical protein
MFVALISGVLLSSAAIAQHEHGASTGGGAESQTEATERAADTAAGQANQANAGANASEASERMICRRFDNTSSRLGRERVCKTAAQWRAYDRAN